MPSITFWNRLEPRPRSDNLANSLAARVRDPAWFLARQWQLGELNGEDAATPAYFKLEAKTSTVKAWAPVGGSPNVIGSPPGPLETITTREPFSSSDVSLMVELGRFLEKMLDEVGVPEVIPA